MLPTVPENSSSSLDSSTTSEGCSLHSSSSWELSTLQGRGEVLRTAQPKPPSAGQKQKGVGFPITRTAAALVLLAGTGAGL